MGLWYTPAMPGQRDADRLILRTPLCDLLGVEYPVCLAGMGSHGRATPPALVAAVSNAGGLGVAGGANLTPGEIRSRIREIKTLTDKPFAVNLLFPASLSQAENSRSQIRDLLQRDYPQHVAFVKDLLRKFSLDDAPVEQESVLATGDIQEQFRSRPGGEEFPFSPPDLETLRGRSRWRGNRG